LLDSSPTTALHTLSYTTLFRSQYHDTEIQSTIASATSIRNKLLDDYILFSDDIINSIPDETIRQLQLYQKETGLWHEWEKYFPLIYYRVLTMNAEELATIQGVDEGIEHRLLSTLMEATSFNEWMKAIKTKRYTWTRIQRLFVHLLTNTKKNDLIAVNEMNSVPYIRLL